MKEEGVTGQTPANQMHDVNSLAQPEIELTPVKLPDSDNSNRSFQNGSSRDAYPINIASKNHYLTEAQIADLAKSGISVEIAKQLGIRNVKGSDLGRYGFPLDGWLSKHQHLMLFPYFDPWGKPLTWQKEGKTYLYGRVKLDAEERAQEQLRWDERARKNKKKRQETPKYMQPPGAPNQLYIPAPLDRDYHKKLQYNSISHMLLTEGEKKTICATLHADTLAIGIGGVWNFRQGKDEAAKPLLYLCDYILAAAKFTVIFDEDIWVNPHIKQAAECFGDFYLEQLKQAAIAHGIDLHCGISDKQLPELERQQRIKSAHAIKEENKVRDLPKLDSRLQAAEDAESEERGRELPSLHKVTAERYLDKVRSLCYTLLPRLPLSMTQQELRELKRQGKKPPRLGLDDWLIGQGQVGATNAKLIMNGGIPLKGKGGCGIRLDDLWETRITKHTETLSFVSGENTIAYESSCGWDSLGKEPKKLPTHTIEHLPHKAKDLVGRLIAGYAAMGDLFITESDSTYGWDGVKRIWHSISTGGLEAAVADIVSVIYGFPDANTGSVDLGLRRTKAAVRNQDATPTHVGLIDSDFDIKTGNFMHIDRQHRTYMRSPYKQGQGLPQKFLAHLHRLMGEQQTELFRSVLRAAYAPKTARPHFYLNIKGGPGCGKSVTFEILKRVLPGVGYMGLLALQNSTANSGYISRQYQGYSLLYDHEFKEARNILPGTVGLTNRIAEGAPIEIRNMGKDPETVIPSFIHVVCGNNWMRLNSVDSEGAERRFLPILCTGGAVPDEVKNDGFQNEIVSEEAEQIINWVFSLSIEEAAATIRKGLNSDLKRQILKEVRNDQWEDIALWIEESIEWEQKRGAHSATDYETQKQKALMAKVIYTQPNEYWVNASQAFKAFEQWCRARGKGKFARKRSNFFEGIAQLGGKIPLEGDGKTIRKTRLPSVARDRVIMLPLLPAEESEMESGDAAEDTINTEASIKTTDNGNGNGHKPEDRLVQSGDRVADTRDPSRVGEVVGYEPGSSAPIAVLWDEQRGQVDISGQYYPDDLRFQHLQLTLMG